MDQVAPPRHIRGEKQQGGRLVHISDVVEEAILACLLGEDEKHCELIEALRRMYDGSTRSFYRWLCRTWKEFAQRFEEQATQARPNRRKKLLRDARHLRDQAASYAEIAAAMNAGTRVASFAH